MPIMPGRVEAEKFVLLGRDGDERGVIQVSDKGTAAIYLNDETGKERAELKVSADGRASLGFYDSNGDKRVVVGAGRQRRIVRPESGFSATTAINWPGFPHRPTARST